MLLRIKPEVLDSFSPDYLSVYLNSIAGQLQSERWSHGVAFYSITQQDLGRFVIPKVPMGEQISIRSKVEEAEAALQESLRLLEEAKQTVEAAILGKG
jgi:restriction endonuclease S subunit